MAWIYRWCPVRAVTSPCANSRRWDVCRYDGYFNDLYVRISNNVAVNMYKKFGYVIYRQVGVSGLCLCLCVVSVGVGGTMSSSVDALPSDSASSPFR